jgi:hypothetical protein
MSPTVVAILVVAAVVITAAAVWMYLERRRAALRSQFGPEYDRVVNETGDPRRADADLALRAKRVSKYTIRPLTPERSRYFSDAWRRVQTIFVDNPSAAVADADALVTELMSARGYPMTDFERRVDDLSVDHAKVVHHYRDAHAIAEQQSRGAVSTEDLRQAVVHYRALFEDLLEVGEPHRARFAG